MLSGAEMLCHYESLITFPTHSRHSQVIYDMNFLNYCKTKKNKTLHSLKARVSSDFDDSDNEQQQKWINEIKSDSHSLPGATRFTKSMMLFYPYKEALLLKANCCLMFCRDLSSNRLSSFPVTGLHGLTHLKLTGNHALQSLISSENFPELKWVCH